MTGYMVGFFLKSFTKIYRESTLLLSAQQFFCTGFSLLKKDEACFHFILLPDSFRTIAYFGSSNNGPKQSKRVIKWLHSLPFAVKVSVRRSFEQFRSLNWGDEEALRIIQSHHVIKHAVFKQSKGFLTACRNTAAYCIFLPFGTPDSGSKFRRHQLFIRYY